MANDVEPAEKARFGYSEQLPPKGCWNCACYSRLDRTCARLYAEKTINSSAGRGGSGRRPRTFVVGMSVAEASRFGLGLDADYAVSECGICGRWMSPAVAAAYRTASSFEEARLKAAVLADGSYTAELDNFFAERKATPKMAQYAAKILGDPAMRGELTPFPLEPKFPDQASGEASEDGEPVEFRASKSFWLVREWLAENAPKYEEKQRAFRRRAYDCDRMLGKFMIDCAKGGPASEDEEDEEYARECEIALADALASLD